MSVDPTIRGFIAISLSKAAADAVSTVQRAIRLAARSAEVKVQMVPRALLYLPLEDLGRPDDASYEAAILAVERAARCHGPFTVSLTTIEGWPEDQACTEIRVMVDDRESRLENLRQALLTQLQRYGFSTSRGVWRPYIPVARIPEGALNLPATNLDGPTTLQVTAISVVHRVPTASGELRFQVRNEALLTEDGSRDGVPLDAEAWTEEIAAELNRRLAQRKLPSVPRKRKRPRQIDDDLDESLDEESMDEESMDEEQTQTKNIDIT